MAKFRIKLVYKPGQASTKILDTIRRMDKKVFPKDIPYGYYHRQYWWIAYNTRGEPVGFAGLDPMHGVAGYLCRCGVLRVARGNRLQRRFLRTRERYAKKIGLVRLLTYTALDNFSSINSLTHSGYKIYRPKQYDPQWLHFRKDF